MNKDLTSKLKNLSKLINELNVSNIDLELKQLHQLLVLGEKIMSGVSEFANQQAQYQSQMSAAIADIQKEISNLNSQIAAFNNSPDPITATDQASLDAIQATSQNLVAQLQALDTINPPASPDSPSTPPVNPPAS